MTSLHDENILCFRHKSQMNIRSRSERRTQRKLYEKLVGFGIISKQKWTIFFEKSQKACHIKIHSSQEKINGFHTLSHILDPHPIWGLFPNIPHTRSNFVRFYWRKKHFENTNNVFWCFSCFRRNVLLLKWSPFLTILERPCGIPYTWCIQSDEYVMGRKQMNTKAPKWRERRVWCR